MTAQQGIPIPADTLRRAYLTIEHLQRKLDQCERARTEPVAIIGFGCRLPGGVVDAGTYWQVLSRNTDVLREIPPDRWDVDEFYDGRPGQPGKTNARVGGFLDHIDRFDYDFFGIPRRDAQAMDPQQRLTLEVVWEALENAGQSPSALAGSRTGVFAAVCTNDFAMTLSRDPRGITAYTSPGTAHSAVPGLVAYALDLRGPSVAVDTACSSALVAAHLASQSLRSGECDLAISGGVNVIMSPLTSIAFSQAGMISRQGRSRPFDAGADGPANGEGCGFVVLKRLHDALRDGDRVLAVLLGAAVNQNGRGSALIAPNGIAQRDVLRSALQASGVKAEDVCYIEAHGSSTLLGDAIEVEALAEVYGHADGRPVLLGSAKGNIGHLQAAGGIAGLIKVILSLNHGVIPPNPNLAAINPEISLAGTTLAIPTEPTPWPAPPGRRIAGVSSFGFTGTNAHLIVGEALQRDDAEPDARRPRSVLALSAKTSSALIRLAGRYADRLANDDAASLADICHSANTGRAHFRHRLAVVGQTRAEVADLLRGFAHGRPDEPVITGQADESDVVFLFTGLDAHWAGLAGEIFRAQPTFRAVMEECDEILRPVLGRSLLSAIYPQSPADAPAEQPLITQSALFCVEYALASLWRSWGVEPAAVAGQGPGEYVAACVAGTMSLPDALKLVAERGRLMEELTAATAVVLAGNCALSEPLLARLRQVAEHVRFSQPRIPLVSSVTGELWPWQQALDADYWCRQARHPVRFAEGVKTMRALGYRVYLEVGPASALIGMISDCAPGDGGLVLLPSFRPDHDQWQSLLYAVARLYTSGVPVDWVGFDRDYRRGKVELPTYPFEPTPC